MDEQAVAAEPAHRQATLEPHRPGITQQDPPLNAVFGDEADLEPVAERPGNASGQRAERCHAGAFAVVVECVPAEMAARITTAVAVPTIGIGAGAGCDGQVLVAHDMLGLFDAVRPRFVKRYAELGAAVHKAAEDYCREVRDGSFPTKEHEFK